MGMYDIIINPDEKDKKERPESWVVLVNPELHPILKLLREVDESHHAELIRFLENLKARF